MGQIRYVYNLKVQERLQIATTTAVFIIYVGFKKASATAKPPRTTSTPAGKKKEYLILMALQSCLLPVKNLVLKENL